MLGMLSILSKTAIVSTIPVKQEFSEIDNILTDYRTWLSAQSLETLIFFHDWLKAHHHRTEEVNIALDHHFMKETTTD
ncbi:unnamed protein product, partial [Cuscuta epithymum]